jgi:hypothetical protein
VTSTLKLRFLLCPLLGLLPFVLSGESATPSDQAATTTAASSGQPNTGNTSSETTPAVETQAANTAETSESDTPTPEPEVAVQTEDDPTGKMYPRLISRITGLFDVELPRLDPPGTFKLIFHPHFGDLIRRGYIRTDVGLRWAVNDNFGITAEVDTYATHGLRSSRHGYGIGQVSGGFKYVIKEWPKARYQTSIGLDAVVAVDHPPVDMTDGLSHYTPNFVVQYRPPAHPRWTTFAGANVDIVAPTNVVGTPRINTPRDDSFSFTSGAIYDMGQVKWTLQATYTTTALIGRESESFYSIRPSVLWYVPKRYTFNSKTQWIFGVGANATYGPDDFHFSSSSRVRAEITFRQVMQKIRSSTRRD